MNPFVYPKSKHTRTETPYAYKSYKSFKPYLAKEFKGQCVYCMKPDKLTGGKDFGADHYRPQLHFPHLAAVYTNLFYCCNTCNSNKGEHWPAAGLKRSQMIPNPCDHIMFSHLSFDRDTQEVIAKSESGEFTRTLLDLNSEQSIKLRNFIVDTIKTYKAKERDVISKLALIEAKSQNGQLSAAEALLAINAFNVELGKIKQNLEMLACA